MLKEETELDTLGLIAIRNMLGVSILHFLSLLSTGFSMRYPNFAVHVLKNSHARAIQIGCAGIESCHTCAICNRMCASI